MQLTTTARLSAARKDGAQRVAYQRNGYSIEYGRGADLTWGFYVVDPFWRLAVNTCPIINEQAARDLADTCRPPRP